VFRDPLAFASPAVGVGSKDPDPAAQVRSSNFRSGENTPRTIKPEVTQPPEDLIKPSGGQAGNVLKVHAPGLDLLDDSEHGPPQPRSGALEALADLEAWELPLSFRPPGSTCKAEILTGEAARNDAHAAPKIEAGKGAHVVPNREGLDRAVVLALYK
jgi:hypothetical protein